MTCNIQYSYERDDDFVRSWIGSDVLPLRISSNLSHHYPLCFNLHVKPSHCLQWPAPAGRPGAGSPTTCAGAAWLDIGRIRFLPLVPLPLPLLLPLPRRILWSKVSETDVQSYQDLVSHKLSSDILACDTIDCCCHCELLLVNLSPL